MTAMQWDKLLSKKRLHGSSQSDKPQRNAYQKDIDRIIFSESFRRLGRKTQVHPLSDNDHVHTRLTHSLEVASVGRSLGGMVETTLRSKGLLQTDKKHHLGPITQAACLAHDIGNPPFGHVGEYAMRHWYQHHIDNLNLPDPELKELLMFEGNAHSFRIVTQLEHHFLDGGLRLTAATLGSMIKYPWQASHPLAQQKNKFGVFTSELNIMETLSEELGLKKIQAGGQTRYARHPLSLLMEAADDICYRILDMEDAVELGIIPESEVLPILVRLAADRYDADNLPPSHPLGGRQIMVSCRSQAIENLIHTVADVFFEHYESIMNGEFEGDLLNAMPSRERDALDEAEQIAIQQIFNYKRKQELEIGAYESISTVLNAVVGSVIDFMEAGPEHCQFKTRLVLDLMGNHRPNIDSDSLYTAILRANDFIAGMTDSYLTHIAKQLRGYH